MMARLALAASLTAAVIFLLSTTSLLCGYAPISSSGFDWIWPADAPSTRRLPERLASSSQEYLLGVGKADITGPVVEINFMGYANTSQVGTGLRQRLYCRAFIVGDVEKPEQRFVYLVLDTQSGDTAIRHGVLAGLAGLGDEYSIYGQQNVAVVGTHSHSGPGAWLNYLLPQITSKGFNKPSYRAIVDGTVKSIVLAHQSLAPGRLSVGSIQVDDANINRSPYAYLQNPTHERQRYQHDVDKTLTLLRFTHTSSSGERDIGVLSWFAVHGTSMLGNNTLVTGDNKGVAAWMFERSVDDPNFVAGFSQANVGDTTPNIRGAYCEYGEQAGQQCDFKTSLCANASQPCHGRGPYAVLDDHGAASAYEIGARQFRSARTLFDNKSAFTPVVGNVVRGLHQFTDFSDYSFALPNGTVVKTCPAALGYSFAAGTSDGPGAFDFKQAQPGDPNANPLWSYVGGLLHSPNETQIACHGLKPILLDVGESSTPYPWTPNIVDLQLFRVGQFFIIVSPGEATTMSGRRWREAVEEFSASNFHDLDDKVKPVVVLGAPGNSYTHYITTPEEYSVQRYEGASTLYGPHTLNAYINRTLALLPHLDSTQSNIPPLPPGPSPPILVNASLSFITPVIVDSPGLIKSFGDQTQAPKTLYAPGDTISARFVGANPRNNFRLGGTFAAVDKFDYATKTWKQIRDDSDWSLVYEWKRTSTILGTSQVTISWETKWETGAWRPEVELTQQQRDTEDGRGSLRGLYRIRYNGDARAFGGTITAFEGVSDEFRIR